MTGGRSACRAACGNMSIADAAFATAVLPAALLGWLIVLWLLTVAPAFVFFLGESDRRYQQCCKQAKKSDLFFHACVSDDEYRLFRHPALNEELLFVRCTNLAGFIVSRIFFRRDNRTWLGPDSRYNLR